MVKTYFKPPSVKIIPPSILNDRTFPIVQSYKRLVSRANIVKVE